VASCEVRTVVRHQSIPAAEADAMVWTIFTYVRVEASWPSFSFRIIR